MSIKNKRKRSLTAVLSSVVAEMAKPRVAESAKRGGKPLADHRDRPANPSVKEVPVPPSASRTFQSEELISSR
jgi:hypothetical protein